MGIILGIFLIVLAIFYALTNTALGCFLFGCTPESYEWECLRCQAKNWMPRDRNR